MREHLSRAILRESCVIMDGLTFFLRADPEKETRRQNLYSADNVLFLIFHRKQLILDYFDAPGAFLFTISSDVDCVALSFATTVS